MVKSTLAPGAVVDEVDEEVDKEVDEPGGRGDDLGIPCSIVNVTFTWCSSGRGGR